jgi:hypothetical protein
MPPQDGADTARTEGVLRITSACVLLVTSRGPFLLLWPADRTTWDAETKTITFASFDGSTVSAGDGAPVIVGGSGDSGEDAGNAIEAWLAATPWVAPPDPSCPLKMRWWVGAIAPRT